jgi:hypothetical protein
VTAPDLIDFLMRNKLCLRMLILSFFFSQRTPLHHISDSLGSLDICRLLLQSNADLQAQDLW